MFGASATPVCGVRDFSMRLGAALEDRGVRIVYVWSEIDPTWGREDRTHAVAKWLERLAAVVKIERPAWIVWHYSVFTYGHRGLPTHVPRVASRLSRTGVPLVGFLHEFAYPFGRRGFRGALLASTQRAALAHLYRVLDAAVVTTEDRQAWLNGRAWLPRRPTRFLPVCSTLPDLPPRSGAAAQGAPVIGVFGFGAEDYCAEPVLAAIQRLRRRNVPAQLLLIGAPGADSRPADRWRAAAAREGCVDAISFTGILEPMAIARTLEDADVIVLPDRAGPSGKKTTLAAALAIGTPVVAFDGTHRWEAMVEHEAVMVTPPDGDLLAARLETLLRSPENRAAQGQRARDFYLSCQAPDVIAAGLVTFLESGTTPLTHARRRPALDE